MPFDVASAADLLIEARRSRRQVAVPDGAPDTAAAAFSVQDRVAAAFGGVAGWKVGSKTPNDEPMTAPILAGLVRPGPADWPSSSLHMIGVEAEIAFRIGRDLPAGGAPLSRAELRDAIASVHAAIEVVDTRLVGWPEVPLLWAVADNQTNGGLVYDPEGVAWTDQDFGQAPVRLTIDGEIVLDGRGGNSAGEPVWLLAWLVEHARTTRGGLPAGTMVTTGSCSGMIFVEPGAVVAAEFPGIGRTEVRFPA
jgi:2-keto-4-pentenoate hydratase